MSPAAAAPSGRNLLAGTIVEVPVTGIAGVPADAEAVVVNVTATNAARPGYLSVFPCGDPVPHTSSVNYGAGDVVPNAVIAEIGRGGAICIFTYAGTDIIVDLAGWFPAGSDYTGINTERLVDTRPTVPLVAGGELVVPVTGRAGIPSTAAAVAVNLTATEPLGAGYLTAYPCGESAPQASNVNYVAGQTVPNLVIAKVGAGGAVCITSFATSDVVVDVFGWFGASGFTPLSPARIADTRGSARVAANGVLTVPVPAGTSAAVVNVTATDPLASGFLTVFPCGDAVPLASNVNYVAGQTVANLAIGKVGTGGAICVYAFGATHVVVDLFGTFGGVGGGGGGAPYSPITPQRVFDSRAVLPVLFEDGIDPLFLGMSELAARATGAIDAPTGEGCELTQSAPVSGLAPPLEGFVQFTPGGSLEAIVIDFGAVLPGGEGPGSDGDDLVDALEAEGYQITFVTGFVESFGVDLLQASVGGDVVFEAIIDDEGVVLSVAAPFIPLCE